MPFLDDIKILDATQMMAGPFATMHFGDLGAEVVKVERPDRGELTRQYDPFVDGMSGYFAAINRNKHCITLDLTTEEGQDIFLELAADADVVIENFKPGTAERFGIDYDSVREENEDVIYCSIKGFGRDSPYTDNPAFDMIVQAMGGAMSITGDADGPPIRSNIPMGDIAPSAYATQSILAALYQRDANGGGGEFIEVSMLNSMISWLASRATYSLIKNEPFPRMGSKHTDFAPYANFETEDSTSSSASRAITSGRTSVRPSTDRIWSTTRGSRPTTNAARTRTNCTGFSTGYSSRRRPTSGSTSCRTRASPPVRSTTRSNSGTTTT